LTAKYFPGSAPSQLDQPGRVLPLQAEAALGFRVLRRDGLGRHSEVPERVRFSGTFSGDFRELFQSIFGNFFWRFSGTFSDEKFHEL
jgi:hypothetical protein